MKRGIFIIYTVLILVTLVGIAFSSGDPKTEINSLKMLQKRKCNCEIGVSKYVGDSLLTIGSYGNSSVKIYFGKNVVSLGNGQFEKIPTHLPIIPSGYIRLSANYVFDGEPFPAVTLVYNSALDAFYNKTPLDIIRGPHYVIAYGFFGFTTWFNQYYVNYEEVPDHGFKGKTLILIIKTGSVS